MRRTLHYDRPRWGVQPRLDVHLPEGCHRASVLLVHGGGFLFGSRRMPVVRRLAGTLVGEGFAVGAVDYRLLGRGGGWRRSSVDVRRAGRVLLDEVGGPLVLLGLSAGGALALDAAEHLPVAGVAVGYGVTDFEALPFRKLGANQVLHASRDPQTWRARSPVHASHTDAPVLLLHGERDALVDVGHAVRLHEARLSRGLPSELHTYPTARHAFFGLPFTVEHKVAYDDLTDWLCRVV